MTLLIFVRCQDGCILASDRKATTESGFSQEEGKCEAYQEGWAVAGAGNSGTAIQKLFADLHRGVTAQNVEIKVTEKLAEYVRTLKDTKLEVKIIVLAARNGRVDASIVQTSDLGTFSSSITAPYQCLGELTPRIVAEHYIKRRMKEREFVSRPCLDVAPEILAILKWACEEGSFVGGQADYGLDIILLRRDGYQSAQRVKDEWAVLKAEYIPISGVPSQLIFQEFEDGARA
jgi:hypothetical protein